MQKMYYWYFLFEL